MYTKMMFVLFFIIATNLYNNVDGSKRVSVNSGLSDAEAFIGKLFRYEIPDDAFDGDVDRYEVTEAGGTTIQNWLVWDADTKTLTGVPSELDSGPNYVQVTAIGKSKPNDSTSKKAKDIFSINVNDENRLSGQKLSSIDRLTCENGPATTMNLILVDEFESMTPMEKINLIKNVERNLNRGESKKSIRLFSNNDDGFNSMKKSILWASSSFTIATTQVPKSAESSSSSSTLPWTNKAVITWRLECPNSESEEIDDENKNWLKLAREDQGQQLVRIFDETLASEGNEDNVLAWYIASVTYEPKRRRRQLGYGVTPYANFGDTAGPTWAVDVTVATIPTVRTTTPTRPTPTRTPTVRIRPTGWVTTSLDSTSRATTPTAPTTATTTSSSTTFSRTRVTRPTTTTVPVVTRKPGDSRPILKNSLGTLKCRQNSVCYIPIPAETFHDAEDGDTTKLTLKLNAIGDVEKPWLHLEESRQQLLGLSHDAGKSAFRLTATDSGNRHTSDAFEITVDEDPIKDEKLNHRIFIHFTPASDEKNSTQNTRVKIQLIQKLAQFFGDQSAEKIRINSMSNSVLSFSNISLIGVENRCPKSELRTLMNKLIKEEDGKTRQAFKKFMDPQFIIQSVRIEYAGNCAERKEKIDKSLSPTIVKGSDTTSAINATLPTVTVTPVTTASMTDDNFFISTILPAIIIALFLIVAALVACILYRRNRKNKKGRVESKSEFVSKGTPIIFPDEVELDKESTAATPMLLKDEKPPLQPLDFHAINEKSSHGNGTGNGHGHAAPVGHQMKSPLIAKSTPSSIGGASANVGPGRVLGKTHVSEAETELWQRPLLQDADENPLYRPPPAFEPTGIKENRSPRPKHASPQQREPPPYVPP